MIREGALTYLYCLTAYSSDSMEDRIREHLASLCVHMRYDMHDVLVQVNCTGGRTHARGK